MALLFTLVLAIMNRWQDMKNRANPNAVTHLNIINW